MKALKQLHTYFYITVVLQLNDRSQTSKNMNVLDELSQSILATEMPDGVTEQMRRARQKMPMSKLTATSDERLLNVGEEATKANAPPALEDIELSSSQSD